MNCLEYGCIVYAVVRLDGTRRSESMKGKGVMWDGKRWKWACCCSSQLERCENGAMDGSVNGGPRPGRGVVEVAAETKRLV